jgi:hypothetical protein
MYFVYMFIYFTSMYKSLLKSCRDFPLNSVKIRDFRLQQRCKWDFALLGCYAGHIDSYLTKFWDDLSGPIFKGQAVQDCPLWEPTGCLETSVSNRQSTPRNIPDDLSEVSASISNQRAVPKLKMFSYRFY